MTSQLPGRRLGILLPSSNTVVETETMALLQGVSSITAHFARFRMVTVSAEDESRQQFGLEPMVQAASLLADVKPDAILWSGTAASWLGFDHDDAFRAAVTAQTGIPCYGTVQIINEILERLGVRRIALVTPYVAALERAIIANYAGTGIETVAAERMEITDNILMAARKPEEIAGMIRRVAEAGPQAIIVMCTNLRGSPVAEALSAELGITVIDSVRAVVQELITRIGG
jgi:maleate isomerase